MSKCCCSGKHFLLVHGSCHGAWCWSKLQSLLVEAGHRVTAIDLAAAGINGKQLSDIRCISDYFEPLFSFLEDLPEGEQVILVGHSRGGLAIGAAMERFPKKVSVGVYATAFMPGPKFTNSDFNKLFPVPASAYDPDSTITYDGQCRFTSLLFGPTFMKNHVYPLSPNEDWTLATMLARPYPYFDDERAEKELTLTEENYGSVNRVYIMAMDDLGITPAVAQIFIDNNPVNEVYKIDGADHMIMFSQPEALSTTLQGIANKY